MDEPDYEALCREIQDQMEWDKSYWWGEDSAIDQRDGEDE